MSCIIIYKDNQPVGVQDASGNSSELFQQILSNPQVNNFEEALGIYESVYSDKIKLPEVSRPVEGLITPVVDRLKETGLATEVYQMTGAEIESKLEELGVVKGKSVQGVGMLTNGFTYDGDVYLNADQATSETAIHEFNHLYTNWLKANRPEVYQKGIDLVAENADGALDEIIANVKKTQPNLEEGSEAFNEEVLTEAVGKEGAKILTEKPNSPIAEWLKEVWDAIKDMLGLSQYTTEQVMEMALEDYIQASAVDLLSGKVLPVVNNTTNSRPIKPFTESYPLSFVKPSDIIDFKALLADIQAKGQKVWFWMGDQLGRGSYVDSVTGQEHFMDAGVSYALDPANRDRGAIWASGLAEKTLQGKTNEADYIFIISGSPTKAKLFNTNVQKVFTDRIQDFSKFKADILKVSKKKDINEFLEGKESFSDFKKAEMKNFIIAIQDQESKKTPLKTVLEQYNAFFDINALRDGFLIANDFKANDVMLVLKPTHVGGESTHSTYATELMGEVVGVPDTIVNSYDIIDEKAKEKYTKGLSTSAQTKVIAAEIGKTHKLASEIKFSKKEPALQYKDSQGNTHASVQEAMKNTPEGAISMGIETLEGFKELASIDTNANINTKEGVVNSLIKNGILNGETFIDTNGKKIYKVQGYDKAKKAINSDLAVSSIRARLGVKAVKALSNGDIVFDDNHTKRQIAITKKDGSTEYVTPEDLSGMTFSQLKSKNNDAVAIVALRDYKSNTSVYGEKIEEEVPFIPENELQLKLLNLLKSMGIKTTSIADYVERYGSKNGVSPSAQALADLANNIIAFKDGVVQAEDLLEETSHFIIAQTPEAEKADIKRNIHKTAEWVEFQASYREIYSQTYSGEELEDIVREEVLGKVLKNAVSNRFQAESQAEQNIYNKVLEFFKNFFTKVEAFFTSNSQAQLNKFTSAVYENLMNDSLNGMLTGENNRHYTLYSTTNNTNSNLTQQYKQAEELLNRITQQQNELSKKYNSPSSRSLIGAAKAQLENLDNQAEEVARMKALLNLARVANSQINTLSKVVNTNLEKGYHFSQEENSVYQSFMTKLRPLLAQVNAQITGNNAQEKQVKDEIEAVLRKSIELEGKTPQINEKALDAMIDRIIKKNSFTDKEAERYRAEIKAVLNVAQKDTQFLHAHLGSLTNAKNGLLNLAGDVIERVQYTERSLYLPKIKNFLTNLEKIGFDPRNLKKFIKDGYIENEVDAVKERKADLEDKVLSYNNTFADVATEEDVEAKLEEVDAKIRALENSKADKDALADLIIDRQEYNRKYKIKKGNRYETYFTSDHIKDMEDASTTINGEIISKKDLPTIAKEVDKFYRSQITQIRLNAENGVLTAADAEEIRELNRQRQQDSYPRDEEGNLKKGLIETYDSNLQKYIVSRDNSVQLSDSQALERDRIYGLQMMGLINQEFYKKEASLNGIPTAFTEELNKLGSEKEKWDFIQLNSYIGFDDTFWENFKPEESLLNRLRGKGEVDLAEEIRAQQQIISNILKQNRKFNNPTETDMSVATGMSKTEIDTIRNASSILENKLSKARGVLKDDEIEFSLDVENRTNEAYSEELEDSGITTLEEEIKFISSNATPSNASYIESARKIAAAIKNGEDVKLNKTFSRVFNENMSGAEAEAALLNYAKSKILPYYKRTEPTGYSDKLNTFKEDVANNVPGTVESLVNGTSVLSGTLKVSPSFTFFESTKGINPDWIANRDAGRPQHSKEWLNRVRNDDYYSKYGIDRATGNRTGNINQKEWEAREELLKLQDWTIDNYGLTGKHNRYLLPQQRKNAVERGIKGYKETTGDWVGYREDELEFGQEGDNVAKKGSSLLTIPVYGVHKVADQNDVSTQLLDSYSWMAQQSALHRARKENISDMLVLNDLILNPNQGYIGKEAEATSTYKMFKSFLHANFYGVKETFSQEVTLGNRKIDLGKIAKTFNNWVVFSNLAGVTVPITSMVTGKVAEFVERIVGESINPMAYNKAHKEFTKLASAAAAEIGGFTSKADLNVILEATGVYNTNERFQNSNYGKELRVGLKASSGLHEIGNFPVTATAGLSVILDYKYYGDDIITFDQFKRKNPTKDASAIKAEWEQMGNFYNDWVVKDGVLTFDKASIAKKINVANLDELINLKMEAISSKTTSVIQRIDAQVPSHQKSIAARDARANFFLTHLNWFLIAVQNKVKDRHYNIAEDTYQEGNWKTAFDLLRNAIMKPKDIKQIWKDSMADDVTRRNLKRTAVELSVANALAIAAMLLAQYVDDEEDPSWFLAWSDYMMTRASVEQISGTVALPKQVGELLTNPLVATQKFYDLGKVMNVLSTEEVTRGAYAGETERMKWARKNLPWIRDYVRLKDPKTASDTYTYFSVEQPNLYDDWTWLSNFFDSE